MAAKAARKGSQKDKDKAGLKDDLDLRDEILNLKRETAGLRKERDKLIIRLRKSEDECKRKDKQIEQLMDPSQNSEIRRLLSMKGAALLLNLKDQNNTLVQMLMEKNVQINRLGSEIKTAKLYSRTNKTEPYRLEISRLRSLLLRSQEALKEAASGPHVASVRISGHSSSASSEGMGPQELEELRYMVHSLETHMQYSKELLAKKNNEISSLSQELQDVLDGHCCRTSQVSQFWPGHHDSERLKYDRARRCTSASTLEPFQKGQSESPVQDSKELTSDKWSKSDKTPIATFSKTPGQLASEDLIRAEKELGELEPKVASKRRDSMKKDKETVKTRNGDRKKSGGKEKWKIAVKKVRSCKIREPQENEAKDEKEERENEKIIKNKIHTNPNANDQQVWSFLKPEIRKKSLSLENAPPKPTMRKYSLPATLRTENPTKVPSKLDKNLVRQAQIEEPSEIITQLELTPRNETEENGITNHSLYRPSIDSSIDSENSSRFEVKLFEVEAEINVFASISSRSESPEDAGQGRKGMVRDGEGGEKYYGVEENADEDDDDDADVITL